MNVGFKNLSRLKTQFKKSELLKISDRVTHIGRINNNRMHYKT